MKFPTAIQKLNKFCAYIAGVVIFASSALAVVESIMRKFFASPTTWSLNLTSGIFIWAAFLASSFAFQELGHVTIDLFRDYVDAKGDSSRKPRRVMAIIGYVMSFVVVCVFLYGGIILCKKAIAFNQLAPYNFKFPLIISYSSIVVGSVLMLVTLVCILVDLCSGGDKYL